MADLSGSATVHTITDSERKAYVEYINSCLKNDPVMKGVIPIDPDSKTAIYAAIKQSVLLGRLINAWFPNAIDEKKFLLKPRNVFEVNTNHDLVIAAARGMGCSIVNIGANDLTEGKEHLILGLTWQVIKVAKNLELQKLAKEDEDFLNLPPEQILLRWFNHHLQNAGHNRVVNNFTTDIQDAENYAVLLGQLVPNRITQEDVKKCLATTDIKKRAEMVLELADRIGCRKFVTATDIVEAHPRLNLAFVANLFNNFPALGPTPEQLLQKQLTELTEKFEKLKLDYDALRQTNASLESDLANNKSMYDTLANQLRELGLKLSEAYADKEKAIQERDELARRMRELEEENRRLLEQMQNVARDQGALTQQLQQERDRLQKLLNEEKAKNAQLSEELQRLREQMKKKLEEKDEELARLRREWETDREKLLARIRELEEENAMLRKKLEEEMQTRYALEGKLRDKEAELERVINESDEHKLILLQRIKQLEEELNQYKQQASQSLAQALKDKDAALAALAAQKEKDLQEMDARRNRDLDKVRLLLTGNTKQGWLLKQKKGVLGGWDQRFLVLKDGNLYWYKDERDVTTTKPLGVLSIEDVRLYELDEKEVKKPHAFQIVSDMSGYKMTVAAHKAEEREDWMTEIRLAKKKKLGIQSAGKETQEQRWRQSMVPPGGKNPPGQVAGSPRGVK